MEVDSIIEMFNNSEKKFGVKYLNYIGDGDSKTYSNIVKSNPYSDDFPVMKNECVGHVQKRMGTRLRNIKKDAKLGGKGRLTDALIKKLTIFYGLAIRRNLYSVTDIKNAIMATLCHYCSTDKKPRHENCPTGADSWCEWRKAQAAKKLMSFKHPPLDIQPDIEVWRLNPEHLNSGKKIVDIVTFLATGIFNEGYTTVLTTIELLDLRIGQQCKAFVDQADKQRVERADQRYSTSTKEARSVKREARAAENEFYEEAEGILYGPGIADWYPPTFITRKLNETYFFMYKNFEARFFSLQNSNYHV